jgi:membrane protease YdiL (CAAX protease family)
MEYKSIKGFTGWGQLGILILFLGVGFILTFFLQLIIMYQIMPAGSGLAGMEKGMLAAMKDPANVTALRLSQVLGTLSLLFIPSVLYSLVTNGRNKFWLGFNPHLSAIQIVIGFAIIFAANIFAGPFADISKSVLVHFPSLNAMAKQLEDAYNEQVLAISNLKSWGEYIAALFIMAFFPAMFEEVFFRGAVQNLLVKWWKRPLLAIFITSIFFSLIHMSIYLFLSRIVLGFVLGLLYYKSRNIWVNIIAHFLNNAIAVTALFYMSRNSPKLDITKLDPRIDWWLGFVGLAALIFLFKLFDRYSKEKLAKVNLQEAALIEKEDPFRDFGTVNT